MFRKVLSAAGFLWLSFAAATASANGKSTQAVWSHHIEAWEARSLDEILLDYTDRSIIIINNEVFRGRQQIRNVFRQLFEVFDNGQNRIDPGVVTGRIVYITWHFAPERDQEHFGTDTFVIEDGKIAVQTIASPVYEIFPITK